MAIPSHLVASKERRTAKKRSWSGCSLPNLIFLSALINRLSLGKRTNAPSSASLALIDCLYIVVNIWIILLFTDTPSVEYVGGRSHLKKTGQPPVQLSPTFVNPDFFLLYA